MQHPNGPDRVLPIFSTNNADSSFLFRLLILYRHPRSPLVPFSFLLSLEFSSFGSPPPLGCISLLVMSWYSSTVLGVSVRNSARLIQPVKVVAFCCLRGMLQYQRKVAYYQHVSSGEHCRICNDKLLKGCSTSIYIYRKHRSRSPGQW